MFFASTPQKGTHRPRDLVVKYPFHRVDGTPSRSLLAISSISKRGSRHALEQEGHNSSCNGQRRFGLPAGVLGQSPTDFSLGNNGIIA